MAVVSSQRSLIYAFLISFLVLVTQCSPELGEPVYLKHQIRALNSPHVYRRQNVSSSELTKAQKILAEAVAQQGIYNSWRIDHPKKNTYKSRSGAEAKSSKRKRADEPVAPSLNKTILAAASLVAEHNAAAQHANGTLHQKYPQPLYNKKFNAAPIVTNSKRSFGDAGYALLSHGDPYWVKEIAQTGHAPMGNDNSYQVFRSVKDPLFGAVGDGLKDDTAAINAAIAYQGNCGEGCESSSVKGTLIYFPPGTYMISTPINAYYYTQLVGDVNDLPIIKTSKDFIGLGAIQSDVYIPSASGGEWYIEQSNFFRQVRNLMIDIRQTTTLKAAGVHWQVAQATSMTNVYIYASITSGTTQMGMFTENGSGGFMSDCFLSGGKYGIYGGNQQYTVRNFEFTGQSTAGVCLLWDWGWTWSGLTFAGGTPVGFLLIPPPEENSLSTPGSIYVMDTLFDGTATAIDARSVQGTIMDTSIITLDNIGVLNVNTMIAFADGYEVSIPAVDTKFVIIGNVGTSGATGMYTAKVPTPAPDLLDLTSGPWYRNNYYAKSRPQYEALGTGSIISVKDHGAVGDGKADDTAAIKATLALATTSNLIFFPAGSYRVTSTIVIPPNTRMTGQVWSQIVASGTFFADAANPQVMVRVGNPNDKGTVEISDMLFTSIGALPGLVMVEWNVQASTQGSVGMWDTHFRVGGAIGTELQVAQCPPQPNIPTGCIAASMMMHLTNNSDGYFENVWAWVADHDIDDPTNKQVTVAVARGILIESSGPVWLYGTASEHAVMYQYNFYDTTNTFAGMIQTESPYFQYAVATESPGPFLATTGLFNNDPSFPDDGNTCTGTDLQCKFSWAVMVYGTTNLTIAGAGLYSWFDAYDQSVCVDAQNCQQRLVNDQGLNAGFWFWNLVTIGSIEMVSDTVNGNVIFAKNNTQLDSHPYWSALAAYANDASNTQNPCDDDSTDPGCLAATLCDYTLEFASLDAIQAASSTFNPNCASYYTLKVLDDMLDVEVTNYTAVNKGYDSVFKYYVEYVKQMVPDALTQFMAHATSDLPSGGPGQAFFNCAYSGPRSSSYSGDCPVPKNYFYSPGTATVTYTLKDDAGLTKALSDKYSVDRSWIELGKTNVITRCGRADAVFGGCVQSDITYVGIPKALPSFTPSNPKDVITGALPQIDSMQDTIMARQMDIATNAWSNGTADVVDVLSMPVFMIAQALQAMASVKSIGKEQQKKDKIALIVEILSIIFAFIPFLDEASPLIGIADGAFEIAAAAGNIGLAIQGIVANPKSAPMEILGALTLGRSKTTKDFADLAAAKRAVSSNDLSSIGATFKGNEDKLEATIKHSCFMKE